MNTNNSKQIQQRSVIALFLLNITRPTELTMRPKKRLPFDIKRDIRMLIFEYFNSIINGPRMD